MIITLSVLLFIAVLYAAIGHGGASGYLAILLIAGFAPDDLRPLVLSMNVVVTIYLLMRTRQTDWQDQHFLLFLIISSIPAAFLGGSLQINDAIYRAILGILLLISAIRLLISNHKDTIKTIRPNIVIVLLVGGLLGFIAGFTGIGGGVLLSPLLILFRWTSIRQSIPIVALFILLNSLSGLAGWLLNGNKLILVEPLFFIQALSIALVGAILGSFWSQKLASVRALRYVLVSVLLLAAAKMIGLAL